MTDESHYNDYTIVIPKYGRKEHGEGIRWIFVIGRGTQYKEPKSVGKSRTSGRVSSVEKRDIRSNAVVAAISSSSSLRKFYGSGKYMGNYAAPAPALFFSLVGATAATVSVYLPDCRPKVE